MLGTSPLSVRKNRSNPAVSSVRIKSPFMNTSASHNMDVTVFHIPGLDVKIHYDSHMRYEDKDMGGCVASGLGKPGHQRNDSGGSGSGGGSSMGSSTLPSMSRKGGTKKASLFAWTTLHSVPEETIISPHILDFLEQTLEPIPMPSSHGPKNVVDSGNNIHLGQFVTYSA